jgi:hypothetical protein
LSDYHQESLVYGYIREAPQARQDAQLRYSLINRSVILSLPRAFNDEWPYLCHPMFTISGQDALEGNYHSRLIYFAASYPAIEQRWSHWLSVFERLLSRMQWSQVKVHLETETQGKHVFQWASQGAMHVPGDRVSRIECEWERELAFF